MRDTGMHGSGTLGSRRRIAAMDDGAWQQDASREHTDKRDEKEQDA